MADSHDLETEVALPETKVKMPFKLVPPLASIRGQAALDAREWSKSSAGSPVAYALGPNDKLGAFSAGAVSAYGSPTRRDYLKAATEALKHREKDIDAELARAKHAETMLHIMKVLEIVSTPPYLMSKPNGSQAHSWLEAELRDDIIYLDKNLKPYIASEALSTASIEFIRNAQIFVVEHDWAAAFKNADVDHGEVRPPYDLSVFEFVINGVRMLYVAANHEPCRVETIFLKYKTGWAALGETPAVEPYLMMRAQVRFICIALDAEVAKTDIIRAPHKLNSARIKRGDPPLYDYHVVSLVKRSRPEALPSTAGTGARKRLHWRRGHWRHFSDHKTWIRWLLAGDPDLGFIDKHYRL